MTALVANSPTRVAFWSTGAVGSIALRAAHARPDLDVVGVWVHDEAKAGRDAGELVGLGPIGVRTSGDPAEVLAARPDCVVYTASGPDLDATNVPVYVALLRAGVDVVTVSSPGLMYPPAWDPALVAELTAAAEAGGATIYASGVEPGFAADQLVAVLATCSERVDTVRVTEIFRYDTYANEFLMCDVFGFGRPLDTTPLMQLAGSQLHAWGPPVHYVAAALGLELDEVRETYERRETPRDLTVAAGVLPAGTCGAVRMETIGVVNGREAIVIEHVNRMAPDLAPDWPDATRDGVYRIQVDGSPSMTCELAFGEPGTGADASEHGMVATAMRLLNAVPYVVAAPPGLVSSLDLPLTLPAGLR